MADLAIDFYGARPDPAAVKAAGYTAVLFYLRNPADPHAYINAGLGVGTIFEYAADESLQGAAKGTADGKLAAQQMAAIGQPPDTVHTVNLADFAPTPGQLGAIEAYWHAYQAETAAWHVLPYGTGWLLQAMGQPGWQNAMNDNAVLGSTVVGQAVLYQRTSATRPQIAGTRPGDYDEDVIFAPLPWWGAATPTAAAPAPVTAASIQLGDTVQAIPFSVTLDAAGWTAIGVTLPADKTKNNVVNVVMDVGSPFDEPSSAPWAWASGEVDYQPSAPGKCRIVVKGDPGKFFTGRVYVA